MHRVICQAAEMWSRKMQRSWWMLLRLLRFQIPSRTGFGQRRIGQEQGQMVAWWWFLVIKSHRTQILMQWDLQRQWYKEGGGWWRCFWQLCFTATCGISIDTPKKGACNGWGGATTPLKDTGRKKCSLTLSQLLRPFWPAASSFSSPSQAADTWTTASAGSYSNAFFIPPLPATCTLAGRILSGSSVSTLTQSFTVSVLPPYLVSHPHNPHFTFYTLPLLLWLPLSLTLISLALFLRSSTKQEKLIGMFKGPSLTPTKSGSTTCVLAPT